MELKDLEQQYRLFAPLGQQFTGELTRQLHELLTQQNVSLGCPIQSRVKEWISISEKIERKSLQLESINDIPDLIGLRVILLFQRSVSDVCELIKSNFVVLKAENVHERLAASEFGYSSVHFQIKPPDAWLSVPTLKRIGKLKAEIQVRTVAQHIWASASHVLQYKQKKGVPPSVRRAIFRVSALLETVDLEFERVLIERALYLANVQTDTSAEILNVDLLAKILDELLPQDNKAQGEEDYATLLTDLADFGIKTNVELRNLIQETKTSIMLADRKRVLEELHEKHERENAEDTPLNIIVDDERLDRGVFFSHVGLVRIALANKFGTKWEDYAMLRWRSGQSSNSDEEIQN